LLGSGVVAVHTVEFGIGAVARVVAVRTTVTIAGSVVSARLAIAALVSVSRFGF